MSYQKDALLFLITFLTYVVSAWAGMKIRSDELPMYSTVPMSIVVVVVGMVSLKYSTIPLPVLGSIFDVISVTGYMLGMVLCGSNINAMQWTGITLLTCGLVIISYFSE